ncbi:hypothetical protein HG530_004843 [Fusarium avenaceum]|nr:hypothetical protein HG530_004843 [Fusarium avenaceum]
MPWGVVVLGHFTTSLPLGPSSPKSALGPYSDVITQTRSLLNLDSILGRENQALKEHLGSISLGGLLSRAEALEEDCSLSALSWAVGSIITEMVSELVDNMLGNLRNGAALSRMDKSNGCIFETWHHGNSFFILHLTLARDFMAAFLGGDAHFAETTLEAKSGV